MTTKIVRINPTVLYSLGYDRPTVEALLNLIRITGNESDGVTVPELAGTVDENDQALQAVKQQVILIQLSTDLLEAAPPKIQPDLSLVDAMQLLPPVQQQAVIERVESLHTEVRQLAEQLAVLMKILQEDIGPRTTEVTQAVEFMQTEVRYIADQQIFNANLIHELRLGTML